MSMVSDAQLEGLENKWAEERLVRQKKYEEERLVRQKKYEEERLEREKKYEEVRQQQAAEIHAMKIKMDEGEPVIVCFLFLHCAYNPPTQTINSS